MLLRRASPVVLVQLGVDEGGVEAAGDLDGAVAAAGTGGTGHCPNAGRGGGNNSFSQNNPMYSRLRRVKRSPGFVIMSVDAFVNSRESSRLATRSRKKKQPAPTVVSIGSKKVLEEATGTDQLHLQHHLINQVCETLWLPEGLSEDEKTDRILSAISLLRGIKPTDEIEGMLAAQMVATHNAAMDCLRRATFGGQTFAGRDLNLKHSAKLLSIYSRQIEVLNKHRGKGQQKVTVEHVHVEAGGQAMVGHIEAGKTGKARRKGTKPGTKAIPNDPAETIDMDPEVKRPEPQGKS